MAVKRIVKVCVLAMGIGALLAGTPPGGEHAASAKEKKAEDDPSRRVCKVVTPTGSRMTKRVCRTHAEWAKSQEKAQDGLLDLQLGESTGLEQGAGPHPSPR